jgi:hypothetical protein
MDKESMKTAKLTKFEVGTEKDYLKIKKMFGKYVFNAEREGKYFFRLDKEQEKEVRENKIQIIRA